MKLVFLIIILCIWTVVPSPTTPPVPPAATPKPSFAPITLNVVTQPVDIENVTVGLVVGLVSVAVVVLTGVSVMMVNWYSTDYELGVSDGQIIDVNKLREDLNMYKKIARTRM